MRSSNVSFFVTLTYAEENLVFGSCGAILCKSDLQKHFKRIRKRVEPKSIKYYACGEYGNLGRPHYHYLIFYRGNFDRFKLMNIIKDSWLLGFIKVLPVAGAQGYVTKYILKNDKRDHEVKPFSCCSIGLGIDYLTPSMVRYHKENLQSFCVKPGGYRINLPRYYKDKIFSTYQKLLMKKRSDLYRRELEGIKLDRYEIMFDHGINPFRQELEHFAHKVYQSLKLYNEKHRL